MEVASLSMHISRALYADTSLDNALKSLRELYADSLEPPSIKIAQMLQQKLARLEAELFDDIWGIGRHRTFQNAFEALCLQPQGNRELWDDVWVKVEQARVTLRQTLFKKQILVQAGLPVDAARITGNSLTNILEMEFPSICFTRIDAAYSHQAPVYEDAPDTDEDVHEGVNIILSSL